MGLESRLMKRYYDIDAANAAIPELDGILARLAGQRAELVRLRDEVVAGSGPGERASTAVWDRSSQTSQTSRADGADGAEGADGAASMGEPRLTRLRMQGLIDQMAAGVARIDALGLALRDIERGLVDFPALVSGRQIWLCWQREEREIGWWHGLDTGFSGRRPLSELA